jgi:hypothetical protein
VRLAAARSRGSLDKRVTICSATPPLLPSFHFR